VNGNKRIVLVIWGMRNNECRERILEVLGQVEGVVQVEVSLIRARALLVCGATCEATRLVETVSAAGYHAAVRGG